MELQFQNIACDCLRRATWEVKNEEQTQEVKLPDAMPDVGRVLGAWGQPLVRSKEWRGSGMGISGGVMAWVLYAPEDASMPRVVETWIPFQMRWDFPQTQRDGAITVSCLLEGIDARSVSARKLMVRAVMSVAGEALEPSQIELYTPMELPEDVQVLRRSYPVCLPKEAGEKAFALDEQLPAPSDCENMQKLICYTLQPEITDRKVMADKVIFRGTARVHALCRCEDSQIKSCDMELPFSQYAELEREYDPYATAQVIPAVTNLELDVVEGGSLRIKAGMIGQYTVYDRPVLEIIEDAYSPTRDVQVHTQQLQVPTVLEQKQVLRKVEKPVDLPGGQVVDVCMHARHPMQRQTDTGVELSVPGSFQLLYYGSEGDLQAENIRFEDSWQMDTQGDMMARASQAGRPQAILGSTGEVRGDVAVDMLTVAREGMPMVTALELGESIEPDPLRPSLILRRVGSDTLWDMAKRSGSTVDAIRKANDLTDEPAEDQVLLIPIS